LNIIDEYSRECLYTKVGRSLRAEDVVEALTELFCKNGTPEYIRSDNGSEFTVHKVRGWLERLGVQTVYIDPGSPWENGYIESFNGKMRVEVLNREVFDTIVEAKVLVELWRGEYNHIRPYSALGYRPPAPEVIIPLSA
jgi:transposase InsO family protein